MRFGLSVETENVEKFKKLVEAFVKKRPREWLAFSAFRLTAISADLGESNKIKNPRSDQSYHRSPRVSHITPLSLQVLLNI
jgi:hypothetical protein